MPPLVNPNKDFQQNVGTINSTTLAQTPSVAYSSPTPTTLNSSSLASTPSVNYQAPAPTPIYPVAGLNSTDPASVLNETAPEKQANDLTTQLEALNNRLVGEQATQTANENAQGVPTLNKDITDLSAKLSGLKNESLAIPLQLQDASHGRGVTTSGLAPIQTAALRQNAIKSLSVASQLEATRGNLTTALDLADRATKQEFDPIREEIAAKTANLKLIMESPAYSLADKKRAQTQLDLQNKKKQELDVAEENRKTIQGLGLQALQNGAPAAVVSAIMASTDIGTAFTAAQGYAAKETATSIQEYQFAVRNGYTGSFSQYQNEDANRKISIAAAGSGSGLAGTPNSYKEWQLAGGQAGTGKTYNQFLMDSNTKAPTVAQQTVSEYAARIEQSEPTINSLESAITNMNYASFIAQSKLPAAAQSSEMQQYMQAARNFINAKLRRESGAVISPTEFTEARAQYLPQPGDTAATLAQKKANRDLVFASLKKAAGPAYSSVSDLLGQTQAPATTSQFADIQNSITLDQTTKTAYIPRSVWSTLGARQDALLAEAAADGYKLLVK